MDRKILDELLATSPARQFTASAVTAHLRRLRYFRVDMVIVFAFLDPLDSVLRKVEDIGRHKVTRISSSFVYVLLAKLTMIKRDLALQEEPLHLSDIFAEKEVVPDDIILDAVVFVSVPISGVPEPAEVDIRVCRTDLFAVLVLIEPKRGLARFSSARTTAYCRIVSLRNCSRVTPLRNCLMS